MDDASLVATLEGEGDPHELEIAADLYRARNIQGLTPQNALRAKVTDAQAAAVLRAFDPATLRLGEVLPVFSWFDRTADKNSDEARGALAAFIRLPLEVRQEIALLDFGSRSARRLALMRAKALGRPELFEAIEARLDKMPLPDRAEAIAALPSRGRGLASPGKPVAE
jgi:hypothetical protein